ncbi:ESX secretion-associated protein EspG [Pseudonocardia xinjiangensis]|uniref:ESX secretion-associated protein EspG n=1 Tax=Pseudonocardia xinjiangensis TaxID=75289 RepID=UPI003D8C6E79
MGLDWTRATVLGVTEFEISWELLGLGETPPQLDPPSAGRTMEERRRIIAAVCADLHRRGLGDDRGPHPVLAERLRLLAGAELTLDLRFRGDTLVAGLAACQANRCTLAVRHGAQIALLDVPVDAAAPALVELIGPVTPGPGAVVTLPAATLDAARSVAPDDPGRFAEELVWRGVPRLDAGRLVRMCSGVRQRGQFGATGRPGGGRRRRAPYVVGMHRTDDGHFRQLRRTESGTTTVTIGPVTAQGLVDDLADLAGAVVGSGI